MDGISQPAVKDVDPETFKGQETVRQGIILLGRDGDAPAGGARPSWALDGSFLVFRYLFQLRPEFDDFKKQKAEKDGIDVELLGARLMGRWKSGKVPLVLRSRICSRPTKTLCNRCTYRCRLPGG